MGDNFSGEEQRNEEKTGKNKASEGQEVPAGEKIVPLNSTKMSKILKMDRKVSQINSLKGVG